MTNLPETQPGDDWSIVRIDPKAFFASRARGEAYTLSFQGGETTRISRIDPEFLKRFIKREKDMREYHLQVSYDPNNEASGR